MQSIHWLLFLHEQLVTIFYEFAVSSVTFYFSSFASLFLVWHGESIGYTTETCITASSPVLIAISKGIGQLTTESSGS